MTLATMILKMSEGLGKTCAIFFLTLLFSLPLGMIVTLLRMSKNKVISGITRFIISILRGTPLMLQLLAVTYGPYYLFGMAVAKNKLIPVVIAFAINYAAYFAEIYRGGIESIPVGQYEAANVLGYTKVQTFLHIILPQVVKRIMPSITNEVVTLVKDTSMAFTVSYQEMFTIGKQIFDRLFVTDEEYNEFYKTDFHDFTDPARTFSIHAEGALSYDALLFIPGRAPYDLYSKDFKKGLALYSSNVLIMEKCEELLPDHFNFVRGVVDSQDLQLNISRETLQHNSQLRAIAKKIEKKITSELKKMRDNDREEYEKFFENFGRGLEFGIYNSYGMLKDQLADLLLFYSAKQEKLVTLDEYLEAAPADQKAIYYAAGESVERLAKMPIVKTVLGKGYDVLLCTKDVDEFCFQSMMTYGAPAADGEDAPEPFELKNVASGDLDLASEEEKKEAEETTKDNEALFAAMKDALGDSVMKVAVSSRLTDAPACITAAGPVSLEMERIMAQMPDGGEGIKSERVLEVNAKHAVFDVLRAAQEAGDADKVKLYAELLYNQALLVEGLPIEDPVAYANAVTKLMA